MQIIISTLISSIFISTKFKSYPGTGLPSAFFKCFQKHVDKLLIMILTWKIGVWSNFCPMWYKIFIASHHEQMQIWKLKLLPITNILLRLERSCLRLIICFGGQENDFFVPTDENKAYYQHRYLMGRNFNYQGFKIRRVRTPWKIMLKTERKTFCINTVPFFKKILYGDLCMVDHSNSHK